VSIITQITFSSTLSTPVVYMWVKDSKKSRQMWQNNLGKIMAHARHQITGPKTIVQSIKLNI